MTTKEEKRAALERELRTLFASDQEKIETILRKNGKDRILAEGRKAYAGYKQELAHIESQDDPKDPEHKIAKKRLKERALADPAIIACNQVIDAMIYREGQAHSIESWALKIKKITSDMQQTLHGKLEELYQDKDNKPLAGLSDEEDAMKIVSAGDDGHRLSIRGRVALLNMPEIAGTGFTLWAFPIKGKEALKLHNHHQPCTSVADSDLAEEVHDARLGRDEVYIDTMHDRKPGSVVSLHPAEPNAHIIRNERSESGLTLHFCFFSPDYGLMLSNEEAIGLIGPVATTFAGPSNAPGGEPRTQDYYYAQQDGDLPKDLKLEDRLLYARFGLKPVEPNAVTTILNRGIDPVDGLIRSAPPKGRGRFN